MPKTLSARFGLAWMLSSVPGMMPKRGAMTPARAVWTIESQTTLSHWSHSAAALASAGQSGGPSNVRSM
jgi:hypothetical protein